MEMFALLNSSSAQNQEQIPNDSDKYKGIYM